MQRKVRGDTGASQKPVPTQGKLFNPISRSRSPQQNRFQENKADILVAVLSGKLT